MEALDLDNVKATEDKENTFDGEKVAFDIPCGAYIVEILKAEAKTASTGTKYIELVLDVAEGAFKDFAKKAEDATGNDWSYKILRAYYGTPKTNEAFKRLLEKFEDSNRKFDIARWKKNWDEQEFAGLIFGVVMDEKFNEWEGKISKKIEPNYFKTYSTDEIDEGKHQKPRKLSKEEKQKLEEYLAQNSPLTPNAEYVDNERIPF